MQNTADKSKLQKRSKILDRTQIALQTINKYEAKKTIYSQHLMNHQNNIYSPYNLMNKLSQINSQYLIYTHHRQLQIDRNYKMQLMPYSQQYYKIEMENIYFPLRILVKHVRNDFTIFIGYDREYPGSNLGQDPAVQQLLKVNKEKQKKMKKTGIKFNKTKKNGKNQQNEEQKTKTFDEYFLITKDILITLKRKTEQPVKIMYIAIVAKESLAMFSLKIESIGYVQKSHSKGLFSIRRKVQTQASLQNTNKQFIYSPEPKRNRINSMLDTSIFNNYQLPDPLKRMKCLKQQAQDLSLKRCHTQLQIKTRNTPDFRKSFTKGKSQQNKQQFKFNVKPINFIQANSKEIKKHQRNKSKQYLEQKKIQFKNKLEKIKSNKEAFQQVKEKQKQVRDVANQFKRMIAHYQKNYNAQQIQKKKANPKLCAIIYATIFLKEAGMHCTIRQKYIQKFYKIKYLSNKFARRLRNRYITNIINVPSKKHRDLTQAFQTFQLHAKIVVPTAQQKAAKIVSCLFEQLKPALIINHVFNSSTKYRRSVRIIQRAWLSKFQARTVMLQYFGHMHARQMLIDFPHFKFVEAEYQYDKICKKICYEYMADQSQKYKNIYAAYLYQLRDIKQFIEKNKQIEQFNKKHSNNPKVKPKQLLFVPKIPVKPQHRIFRNLDILKAMLRGWFQLKFKSWKKRQTS